MNVNETSICFSDREVQQIRQETLLCLLICLSAMCLRSGVTIVTWITDVTGEKSHAQAKKHAILVLPAQFKNWNYLNQEKILLSLGILSNRIVLLSVEGMFLLILRQQLSLLKHLNLQLISILKVKNS